MLMPLNFTKLFNNLLWTNVASDHSKSMLGIFYRCCHNMNHAELPSNGTYRRHVLDFKGAVFYYTYFLFTLPSLCLSVCLFITK